MRRPTEHEEIARMIREAELSRPASERRGPPVFNRPQGETLRTVQSDWPQRSSGIGDASAV